MDLFLNTGLLVFSGLSLLGFGYFGIVSLRERESRAARISFVLAFSFSAWFALVTLLPYTGKLVIFAAVIIGLIGSVIAFLLPVGRVAVGNDTPRSRFDERDIMFARARLAPGTQEYDSYYAMRPENKSIDDRTRSKPGLLDSGSLYANPLLFASPKASFGLTEALRDAVDGPVSGQRLELPPGEMSAYLKDLSLYYGALDVGITHLEPYHVYSHIGRGVGTYGEAIQIEHTFALAFTVEMDYEMVATGPKAPAIMESARQYVEAARVAVQLANLLREMGYSARAHIDGNYRVIAPLVARDAGLGEIGRMGLLMTTRQGPRVRLGVVTTDVELIADEHKPDPSVIDFCRLCKKCAQNCPSRSISFDHRQEIDGALRWRIDSETCFHYWNVVGTDCARCMAVCPYAHPDSFSHNLIRWGISRSGAFRRAALVLDDFFYGKKPAWKKGPDWIKDR